MKKCPFCNKEFKKPILHVRTCVSKPKNKTAIEIKELYYMLAYDIDKNIFIDDYLVKNFSLPDLNKKYNLSYRALQFLLTHWNIKIRNIAESSPQRNEKIKETCLSLYGVENTLSKNGPAYLGRIATLQKKYGVNNSFLIPDVHERIHSDEVYMERHGCTYKEHKRKTSKKAWAEKSLEEQRAWLTSSLLSGTKGGCISKLEKNVGNVLLQNDIAFISQYSVRRSKTRSYYFDYFIPALGLVIEVNGDYWHANPVKYKPDDTLCRPGGSKIKASAVWENDSLKQKTLLAKGHTLLILWENDLKRNEQHIQKYILGEIHNATENQKNQKNQTR